VNELSYKIRSTAELGTTIGAEVGPSGVPTVILVADEVAPELLLDVSTQRIKTRPFGLHCYQQVPRGSGVRGEP
jgi:hypothetical protein